MVVFGIMKNSMNCFLSMLVVNINMETWLKPLTLFSINR
jgi:hypothetical protein